MFFKTKSPETKETQSGSPSVYKPNPAPLPIYFFSHGGPTFMYEGADLGNLGAWRTINKLGKKIKNEWKPDYIIVVSAHWQLSGSNMVEVAVPKQPNLENSLIYDFYGFPRYMYEEEFHLKNSHYVAEEIRQQLKAGGFHLQLTPRGLDHGVWVPFKIAFSDYTTQKPIKEKPQWDLPDTAVIQVSLTALDRDFDAQYKLGQVLSKFRENLIWDPVEERYLKGMVITSGMSVHNLRDLGIGLSTGKVLPYVKPFSKLLNEKLDNSPEFLAKMKSIQLENGTLLKKAHPTLEHFVPLLVAGGAINHNQDEPVKELYNDEIASLAWGIYQFGKDA